MDEKGVSYSRDDEIVDAAIQCIHNRPKDQLLCVFLGLEYPHVPYQVEEPYYSAIKRPRLPPRIRLSECQVKSEIIRRIHQNVGMDGYSDADWDELRAVYLGMCMKVDSPFGKLMQYECAYFRTAYQIPSTQLLRLLLLMTLSCLGIPRKI